MSLLGQLKPVAIKLKITQCDKLHIFTPRCSNTFQIWTFLWNYLYISHLKEIYPKSLLGQLKPVAIKLKITQYDRWPIFSPRWYKTLRIRTFYRKYHYNSHLIEDLLDNTEALTQTTVVQIETEFEHFFEIIPILAISKKYIRCRCSDNLNQLRSSWKLLNAINYTYSIRVVQIHFKFEHFFEIIPILAISKKYIRCRCSDNLNQLRSSWKLLNTIDDPYLVHVDTKHFEFGHFIASITIIVISLKIY